MKQRDLYNMYYSSIVQGLLANPGNNLNAAKKVLGEFDEDDAKEFVKEANLIMMAVWKDVLLFGGFSDEENTYV